MISFLLVSPRKRDTNAIIRDYGQQLGRVPTINMDGALGTVYRVAANLGVFTIMQMADLERTSQRLRAIMAKYPQTHHVGVINPPAGLENHMRQSGGIPLTLYFLSTLGYLEQFLGRQRPNLAMLFASPPPPLKERKKKRPKAQDTKVDLTSVKQRKVEVVKEDDDDRACAVCMENRITHLCVPCMHFVLCPECAPQLKDCPMCREPIKSYLTPITK